MADTAALTLRPLRPDDRPQWAALWAGYLDFYETSAPAGVEDSTFARLLGDDPRDFSALVAEMGGQLVGLAHYLFHRNAWAVEDVCYLQDLFVAPDRRGTGIARALIEAVYGAADAAGAPGVYWLTAEDNVVARRLYDRIGTLTPFRVYERR